MDILIDALLAILTIYLAFRCMMAQKLSKAIFMFFAFGLMLALAWIRLGAVDVAIAEAAIASGFMGVLMLDSLRDFSLVFSKNQERLEEAAAKIPTKKERYHWITVLALGLGLILFLLISLQAIWEVPQGGGLTAIAEANLTISGVDHPVTAVLLNYRAYDTLLEIGVILMGLLAIFAAGGLKQYRRPSLAPASDPLLRNAILIFIPVLFLFGAFLLYFGKMGPGGAFQAAVLWGSIGILLHLGGWPVFTVVPRRIRQILVTIGLIFFLLVGLAFMALGGAFIEYTPAYAGLIILVIETFAAISIAAALTAIFAFLTK